MVYEERGKYITMNKKIAKLLALGMSIALVFSLAACGDTTETPDEPETTTEEVITTEAPAEPVTGEAESVSESESGEPASTEAPGVPTDKTGIVNLFNSAVDKISSTSATYDRTIATSGGLVNAMGYKLKFDQNGDESAQWQYDVLSGNFDRKGEPLENPVFTKLDSSAVANAIAKDNGDSISIDITLNDTTVNQSTDSGSGATDGWGTGGYMYFVNFNMMDELLTKVIKGPKYNYETKVGGFDLPLNPSLKDATFTLTGGQLTATLTKDGKLTSASVSFSETLEANAKVSGLPADCYFTGSGTVNFSFK